MNLILLIADIVVNEFPLDKDLIAIGRATGNQIILDDPLVSAYHAQICVARHDGVENVSIEDLGSTNGTQVNGKGVRAQRINPGDIIQIGRGSLRIVPSD